MLAAKFHGIEDIRVQEVPSPQVGLGEVLVRTRVACICTSDLEAYRLGHKKLADYCPDTRATRTPGHEFAGDVVEIGPEVKGISEGTRVAIAPNYGCGKCRFCREGIYPLCPERRTIGLDVDGGFAEYVKIPKEAVDQGVVCAFSENLPYEEAALNEPLACAYNGLMRCNIQPGEVVLVAGGGPVGMMHVVLAKLRGAKKVIVAEQSGDRQETARKFGADAVVNPMDKDYVDAVRKLTDDRGADVIIIACGAPKAQEMAPSLAATQGRINFFGKVPVDKQIIGLNSNLVYSKELSIYGAYGSRPAHFAITLSLLDSRKIDLSGLISRRFSAKEIPEAYNSALANTKASTGMKTIICFT